MAIYVPCTAGNFLRDEYRIPELEVSYVALCTGESPTPCAQIKVLAEGEERALPFTGRLYENLHFVYHRIDNFAKSLLFTDRLTLENRKLDEMRRM